MMRGRDRDGMRQQRRGDGSGGRSRRSRCRCGWRCLARERKLDRKGIVVNPLVKQVLGQTRVDQDLQVLARLDEDILRSGRVELLLLLLLLLQLLLELLLQMWLLELRHHLRLRLAQLVELVRLQSWVH